MTSLAAKTLAAHIKVLPVSQTVDATTCVSRRSVQRRNKQSRACNQIMRVGKTEQRHFQSVLELSECQGCVTGRLR